MQCVIVTGSAGLVGSEAVKFFAEKGFKTIGIDNDMRSKFFGKEASTEWNRKALEKNVAGYEHHSADIRDDAKINEIFQKYSGSIAGVIHAAAQPSHDWAAKDPHTDFTVNANGTLTVLEAARKFSPTAPFIFTSTNKVYGDNPNSLPLVEEKTRWEIDRKHPYYKNGIDESLSVDKTKHSLFGVSKLAADALVQEYGKYFGMKTVCFRAGCITGSSHSSAELHGFLAYLMKCAMTGKHYTIFGYKGKQVRDNIHAYDLVTAFWNFFENPREAEIYNMGGGRHSNCSMLEAIELCENISGKKMSHSYSEANRTGDHIWWISDVTKFQKHYPKWKYKYDVKSILEEMEASLHGAV
ncbi:MAG: NAD-dependent epimerase/dehydratase family protein [Candidatus Aenigmarchaeota archaeon]|nr:NAD-dependent epimerase/dehydratase family protein [Candidatus Aenigmarchaeota archaeon]